MLEKLQPVLRRYPAMFLALLALVLAGLYWLLLASDQYVSEARIVMQRASLSGGSPSDVASLLTGANPAQRTDQLNLREHLLSLDMLAKAEAQLALRAHFSSQGDALSRLSPAEVPLEKLHEYYLRQVRISMDEYSGALSIRAQAYTPEMAQRITQFLLAEGEQHMNRMGHELALQQVQFMQQQVQQMEERVQKARAAVLDYQNQQGLVSPQATVDSLSGIVGRLQAQLTELQTQRNSLLGYLQASAPEVIKLQDQMAAVEKQLQQEQARLAAPKGKTLNTTVETMRRLQAEAEFSQQMLNSAHVALEKGRIEATRLLQKTMVLQSPHLPEYPLEPRRLRNWLIFSVLALLLGGVLQLLLAIVRDHQD